MINEKQFRSLIIRPVGFVRQTFFLSGFSPWNLSKALRTFGKGLVQIRQQNRRNTERGGKGKYGGAITSHQLRMSVNASSHFGLPAAGILQIRKFRACFFSIICTPENSNHFGRNISPNFVQESFARKRIINFGQTYLHKSVQWW